MDVCVFVGGAGVQVELGTAVSVETIFVAVIQDIDAMLIAKIEVMVFAFTIPFALQETAPIFELVVVGLTWSLLRGSINPKQKKVS